MRLAVHFYSTRLLSSFDATIILLCGCGSRDMTRDHCSFERALLFDPSPLIVLVKCPYFMINQQLFVFGLTFSVADPQPSPPRRMIMRDSRERANQASRAHFGFQLHKWGKQSRCTRMHPFDHQGVIVTLL